MTAVEAVLNDDGDGRRSGVLRIPLTAGPQPYGVVPVPIVELGGGDGPKILLVAGNHGDEYEGRVILQRLIQRIDARSLRGRLLILPALNLPAVQAGTRISPLDGGDMNRSFPGNADGGPTEIIAHYLEHEILPGSTAAIDLHAGGVVSEYVPCTFVYAGGPLWAKKLAVVQAFSAPNAVYVSGGEVSLSAAAERQGVPLIAAELAGGGSVSRQAVEIGWAGVLRVLNHCGMLDAEILDVPSSGPIRHLFTERPEHYVVADGPGLFEPAIGLGETVVPGAIAGWIHPEAPSLGDAREVIIPGEGVVVCRRVPARVEAGDYLFHLGRPVNPDSLT